MSPVEQDENVKGQEASLLDEAQESYSKWLTECEELAEEKLNVDYSKFIHDLESYIKEVQPQKPEHAAEFEKQLNQNALKNVMDQSALAFFHHKDNNSSECLKWLDKAQNSLSKFVEGGQIPGEHQQSFFFIFNSTFSNSATLDDESCEEEKSRSMSELPLKSQACVYGVKQHFFHVLRMDYEQEVELLHKAIELDGDYYFWHLKMYETLQKLRRRNQYHHYQTRVMPSEEEKKAILTACKLQPDHPSCLIGEILMLAQHVKAHTQTKEPTWKIIEHNGIEYKNVEALVSFIKEQAKKIMASAPTAIECPNKIAQIFTKLVPKDFKDFEFSFDCLNRCLKYHPNSALLKFCLADCFLSHIPQGDNTVKKSMKETNISKAQHFLESALENYSYDGYSVALLCLIQVLLGQPKENEKKLLGLFEKERKNPMSNPWKSHQILFLKAIFCLKISSRNDEAMGILCRICEENERELKFEDLTYQSIRYGWRLTNREDLTLLQVRNKIENAIKSNTHRNRTLKNILTKVDAAIEATKNYRTTPSTSSNATPTALTVNELGEEGFQTVSHRKNKKGSRKVMPMKK